MYIFAVSYLNYLSSYAYTIILTIIWLWHCTHHPAPPPPPPLPHYYVVVSIILPPLSLCWIYHHLLWSITIFFILPTLLMLPSRYTISTIFFMPPTKPSSLWKIHIITTTVSIPVQFFSFTSPLKHLCYCFIPLSVLLLMIPSSHFIAGVSIISIPLQFFYIHPHSTAIIFIISVPLLSTT